MGVLRDLFGPSKQEIWQQLCDETGSRYVGKENFFGGDKVQADHGEWTITLDIFNQPIMAGKVMMVIPHTRMRAPYVNKDAFRFEIYRRGLFSDIAKWFGSEDIEVGHQPFDEDFVIKGSSPEKLTALFANPRIRELLSGQPRVYFSVKDDEGWFGTRFPQGVDELHFMVDGVITDVESLKLLYELLAETLDHLCRIDSAYQDDPNVEL